MVNELVIFESEDGTVSLDVNLQNDTVWLSRKQIAELFGRDVKTIGKHINNALREELDDSTVAKIATVQKEGARDVERVVEHYDLDMIIAVGYRVKSKRGIEFRRWANFVLKEYILKGYAVNDNRMKQLHKAVEIMKRVDDQLGTKQILSVIDNYSAALDLLDDYDHQTVSRPKGTAATYVISYEECRKLIDELRFNAESSLFGNEKDDSFKGSIGAIYQSFEGKDIYPSMEEKAANLLYFITKNHSFSDGNKRISAAVFLFFLEKNDGLYKKMEKRIDDYTLVALTIMIAESRPSEKEMMISLIMNCLK